MVAHTNFYESVKEAQMRLRNTIVMYDKKPHWVLAITDHKKDTIYRIYLEPIGRDPGKTARPGAYDIVENYGPENPALGTKLDDWLDVNPNTEVIRKQMNSPMFDKFRPFPLGMCNYGNGVIYCERQPLRPKTEQGLTMQMIVQTSLSLADRGAGTKNTTGRGGIQMFSPAFKACVMGTHPSAQECLAALNSGEYANEAIAFHREFAFVVGPVGLIFLAYKGDVVGVLPKGDFSYLKLDTKFAHVKEIIESLALFNNFI